MSTEENKAMVRRVMEESHGKGNFALAYEFVSPDYIVHGISGQPPGPDGIKQTATLFRTAFPDLDFHIEDQIAEGDKVVSRWTARGTHQGEFMGIPPTSKQVTLTGISIWRIAGGKAVEAWVELNMLGLMQQLGVILR